MRSYPSWIAGLKYPAPDGSDRGGYCAGLAEGSLLEMVPEPSNKFDSNAVALHHNGKHLGYIPQRHAWVGQAIRQGKILQCAVIEVEVAGGGIFSKRRAEHVETRISVVADAHPGINTSRAAAKQEAKEQKQSEQQARAAARQQLRDRKILEDRARKCCADGLRVLAYLATVDGRRSSDEHNIEISVIESRLIASGFERDADILAMLAEQAAALGEVCEVVNGGTPKTGVSEYWGGNHLWITPAEMGKRINPYVDDTERKITDLGLRDSSARMLPPHSVILSSRAPIGHLVINTSPMATNQGCKGLVPSNQIDHKFLYYYLGSIVDLLNSLGTGATFKELSGGKLKEVTVPCPPFPEQQRIVGILDEATEGIATAEANAEKNLENAHALFDGLLNSTFGSRGEKWEKKSMGEVCEVKDGTHDSPRYADDGIPFVTQKNIRENGLSFEKTRFIRPEDHDNFYRRSNAAYGDILISMIGANRGMACIVDDERTFSIKNVGLVKQNASINPQFLLYYLKSPQAANYVQSASKGGAQEFVGLTELRKWPVPVPSLERQNSLVEQFQSVRKETQRLAALYRRKFAALEALKKSLLHQAFTGNL